MSLASYSDLKTAVASWANRSDLTAVIPDFITLAESDMQVRCKLVEFEATGSISVTAGVGTLPADWVGARSLYWDGDLARELKYITPDRFDIARRLGSGDALWYTISGTTIRTSLEGDGTVIATYNARFTPLSDSATSNALLANFPDVYLYGALKQVAIFLNDQIKQDKYSALMEGAVARIIVNNQDRKYAGATLQVRPA